MRLSTSNSDERIPGGALVRQWLAALLVAIALLSCLECFWRSVGYKPMLSNDDKGIWALQRARLSLPHPPRVVFAGSSRMQAGIALDVFADRTGGLVPVQLAIPGGDSLPVLENLAQDEHFRGLVVCDFVPSFFCARDLREPDKQNARDYVDLYSRTITSPSLFCELCLKSLVEANLCFRLRALAPAKVAAWCFGGEELETQRFTMRLTRQMLVDRDVLGEEGAEMADGFFANSVRSSKVMDIAGIDERIWRLERAVHAILNKGGTVVMLRMPVSGHVKEEETVKYPRNATWDKVVANLGIPAVHYEDYRQLATYECAEGSHMDFRDAERFTADLVEILSPYLTASSLQ